MQVVLMGVSGSGKSYLADRLVAATGWAFAEGDDYFTAENKAQMHAGIPMTDVERGPWLAALHAVLVEWDSNGVNGVMTCSALKRAYRDRLREGLPTLRFVWLDLPKGLIAERLGQRVGHYMPAGLLDSQVATLEPPGDDERVLRFDGSKSTGDEIGQLVEWLDG